MAPQNARLLEYLQEHKSIMPLPALRKLGIYRLGARVYELRKEGHKIETVHRVVRDKFGGKCVVADYRYQDS